MIQPLSLSISLADQLKNLEQMQELDLKIDSLKKNQTSLPTALKAMDENLKRLKIAADSKTAAVNESSKSHGQAKAALDLNKDRLARASSKLEAVQNAQEYQAATKEIEQLKKLNASLEEQEKKAGADLESLEKELKAIQEQYQKQADQKNTEATAFSGQDQKLSSDLSDLVAKRDGLCGNVEARILLQYNRVRTARGGLGIVPVIGGRCKGCNMVVPAQLYNEVQRGSTLHSCPSCHRILYSPGNGTAESSPKAS